MGRALILAIIVVSSFFAAAFLWRLKPPAHLQDIRVDCETVIGRIRSLQGMNCGPLEVGGRIDLSGRYIELGVNHVRTHDFYGPGDIDGIFPDFNADPALLSNYDFEKTDFLIEGIKDIGADVIFRLGYSWAKPSASITHVNAADRERWAEICRHVVMHYNEGWADGYCHNITYWEIWNEPDIDQFWTGTPEEFYDLYEVTAKALKDYDPSLKIGGPGIAYNLGFADGFIEFCGNRRIPLDFFSWHIYQGDAQNPHRVCDRAKRIRELLDVHGFHSAESLLTEWNIAAGGFHREWWNVKGVAYAASFLMYMQETDIEIANRYRGDSHVMGLFNGFGSARKPFYAFKAFKMLLETPDRLDCVGSDESGYAVMAGKSDDGKVITILISDFSSGHDGYRIEVGTLPWGNRPFRCERYLLEQFLFIPYNLKLVESTDQSGDHFLTIEKMNAPSVQLIRLSVIE